MRYILLPAVLGCLLSPPASADGPAGVLIEARPPAQGSLPEVVIAYGSAAPALDGGMTLSLQQDGRVTAIAVTPGEAVAAGQLLMGFDASATASNAYQQAVGTLSLARTQRTHIAQMLSQQLATRDQLAQADKAVADAQSSLDALRREGAGQTAQGLLAPFAGIVAGIPVGQGDRVAPGAPLLTLTRLDGLVVTVGMEPADRGRLHPGQAVRLEPLAGGAALSGQLLRIDSVLNPHTRLVDADLSVPQGAVLSGEAFRATITVGQTKGWLVPHDAVLTDAKGAFVFQVDGDKAARVDVSLAGGDSGTDIVQGHLDPKRPLVVQGSYQLSDGAAVRQNPGQPAP